MPTIVIGGLPYVSSMSELGIAILTALTGLLLDQDATLLFVGDAMMHTRQIEAARGTDGTYDYSGCFKAVAPLIQDADYAVVNLETPLASAPYSGYPMFNAPDSYALSLADTGFDLFLTANNHTLDRHDRGLRRTIDVLDCLDVDHIGTYHNAAERDSALPLIKDINGYKIGFLNYTYGTNGINVQGDVVVDYIDRDKMRRDIQRTRKAGAELICVAVHWGNEYQLLPHSTQVSLAKFLVDQGVELVIGGHPHVIQPMEMRRTADGVNHLVVYSLGNFISNMNTTDTRGGAVVRAHLKRDIEGKAYVDAADYDLVFTIPPSSAAENFRLVYADSCDSHLMKAKCDAFKRSAKNIFDKHNVNVNKRASF